MSDDASHQQPSDVEGELFSTQEQEQFSADDVKAGGDIGKMLSALFLYTVVAMGIASWWSWSSIVSRSDTNRPFDQGAEAAAEHADGEH